MLHGSSNQHAPNHAASTSQSDADLTEVRGDLSSLNLSGQLTPQLSIKTDRQLLGISSHSRQIPNNNGQSTISPDNIGMNVTPETSAISIVSMATSTLVYQGAPRTLSFKTRIRIRIQDPDLQIYLNPINGLEFHPAMNPVPLIPVTINHNYLPFLSPIQIMNLILFPFTGTNRHGDDRQT